MRRAESARQTQWFIAAQALAMLEGDLWLSLAEAANGRAHDLSNALCAIAGTKLVWPVDGNEVFVELAPGMAKRLLDGGATFYPWPGGQERYRLVCSWMTSQADIDAVRSALS